MPKTQLPLVGALTWSPAILLGATLLAMAHGCGPTNTYKTEYHERTNTSTSGDPTAAQQPNAPQQPPPVIEERRSAPETIVQ